MSLRCSYCERWGRCSDGYGYCYQWEILTAASDGCDKFQMATRLLASKNALDVEAAKVEMAQEYGLDRDAKFEIAWRIAWGFGHSSGIDEVKYYFRELAELIKP